MSEKIKKLIAETEAATLEPEALDPIALFTLINALADLILRLIGSLSSKGDLPADLVAQRARLDKLAVAVAAAKTTY